MFLVERIKSGLKTKARESRLFSQLCKPKWTNDIIEVCNMYQERQSNISLGLKIEEDIKRLEAIISITESLTEALWNEPVLHRWYDDEGLGDALEQISNGSYAASLLCNKAIEKLKKSANNRKSDSPENQFFHGLACIYEEACAFLEKREPDYELMPSLAEGIFETSYDGQKYFTGGFFELVEFLWQDCLEQPLCRRNTTRGFVDSYTRRLMDRLNFGKKVLKGIAAARPRQKIQHSEIVEIAPSGQCPNVQNKKASNGLK